MHGSSTTFVDCGAVEEGDMAERWIENRNNVLLLGAVVLALAIVVGGYLLGDGLRRARMADRAVTVRGLAERNVTADLASWTIAYSEPGTVLGTVLSAYEVYSQAVRIIIR